MFHPKLVLAPIDFSVPSLDAVESAADVASRFGAGLLLVHVVPALPRLPPEISIFKEGEYEDRLHQEAVKRIDALTARYSQRGISVRSEVGVANDVGMEILRAAERSQADLIVIATHGETGFNRLVFGSIAEKVVRMAPCPVLVLRASSGGKQ
jgi:nucleotide-binding universal stress UspA family protein